MSLSCKATNQGFRSPLYNSHANQIKRAIGKHSLIYCDGNECGTVMDASGQCWDWWLTDEVIDGIWYKIRIEKAV